MSLNLFFTCNTSFVNNFILYLSTANPCYVFVSIKLMFGYGNLNIYSVDNVFYLYSHGIFMSTDTDLFLLQLITFFCCRFHLIQFNENKIYS